MELTRQIACAAGLREFYFELWWRFRRDGEPKTSWCEQNRAFFIHIPKTAGTSLYRALGMEVSGFTHAPARVLNELYPDDFKNSYSFAVARNPWDRMVSIFEYIKHGTDWPEQKAWGERHLKGLTFSDFVHKLDQDYFFRTVVLAECFLFPQTYFTHDRLGRQMITEIFYFENIDEAFRKLKSRFGVDAELSHSRKSKPRKDFRDYYSDHTADIIGKLYAADISAFGYAFDQ